MNIVNSLRSGGLVGSLCTLKTSFRPRTPLGQESCRQIHRERTDDYRKRLLINKLYGLFELVYTKMIARRWQLPRAAVGTGRCAAWHRVRYPLPRSGRGRRENLSAPGAPRAA